ncbi:hypothetical protein QA601_18505 [Chitinispirillales bacterium ANBcel5]|uniref:hypothetical protein n=1 Tax=Cellulosispirillum alkaliphilum TaxID=3039283 RepID=UPI002A5601EA|nr:hypothetical protein [Chitinispirillales bacterium ANBcel5]
MIKNYTFLILVLWSLLLFVSCTEANKQEQFDFGKYLQDRWGIDINNENLRIKYHSKEERFESILKSHRNDTSSGKKQLKTMWPTEMDLFIREFYMVYKNDTNKIDGLKVFFPGDSTWYNQSFFTKGLRDSVWYSKSWDYIKIENNRNGRVHGKQITKNHDGVITHEANYADGVPVDTVINRYSDGTTMEIRVYEKGEIIIHKCYDRCGEEYPCEFPSVCHSPSGERIPCPDPHPDY